MPCVCTTWYIIELHIHQIMKIKGSRCKLQLGKHIFNGSVFFIVELRISPVCKLEEFQTPQLRSGLSGNKYEYSSFYFLD